MNLEKLIDLENVSLNLDAKHPETGEKAKDVFCGYWPVTKKALEIMVETVKNPIVKVVVKIVITVGEGISQKMCK